MSSVFEQAKAFFDARRLAHHPAPELGVIRVPYQGHAGQWNVVVRTVEAPAQLAVYGLLPIKAPEALRARVGEAVSRANWGLVHGNFELDVDDGELRFRTSAWVGAGVDVAQALEPLLFANTATVDRYLPAFTAIVVEGRAPKDAIARVESEPAG
jgi:hypothetical protein